jgi:dTDP-4-amino-4,6-dideoxygalactose transaminase
MTTPGNAGSPAIAGQATGAAPGSRSARAASGAPITFNRPYATGGEFAYIEEAIQNSHLSGNGPFTDRCADWLQDRIGAARALLTFSCTSALEMAAILADLQSGDEVIMPSFTFVTTASSVALRGAVPVFVDVRPDTLNLDIEQVASAITPRTKAIVPVHYAGVGCEMDAIAGLARDHELVVIEDAAQAIGASYRGRALGGIGELGCLSFHETKNVHCGEGGALLVNADHWVERAEIIQEKGTNRRKFFRGEVDKYTWVDLGSSFLTSEINAAYLWAQLEAADEIMTRRLGIWNAYHERFDALDAAGRVRRPVIPEDCEHNAHLYYLLLSDHAARDRLIDDLRGAGVQAVFHYIPLHSSPAGERVGRAHGALPVTDRVSECLVRMPLWVGMGEDEIDRVVRAVERSLA